jgi:glycosyltransferase involved in cell wall biosynthesis
MAAIHYGCLIVTTKPRVDIPEFVDGQNMLLVPPGDPDALTTALRHIHETPQAYRPLRQASQALAERFAWDQIAADTLSFFQKYAAQ